MTDKMEDIDIKTEIEISTLKIEDFSQVMEILKETEWPIGLQSPYTWYNIDPEGWKVAITKTGKILGMCCAVRHENEFHFVGFYAVRKIFRGKGIGPLIWDACMDYIGARNACLCATSDMVEKYRIIGGFSFVDDQVIYSYESHDKIRIENLSSCVPEGITILPFHESQLTAIFKYDYSLSGQNRQNAIELNFKEGGSKSLIAFNVHGACVGYGTIKICLLNIPHLAPLYADDENIAEVLMKNLILSFPDYKGFSMGTFSANKAAVKMMQKIGCPIVHEWFHIYKKEGRLMGFKQSIHKLFSQFDVDFTEF